MTYPNPQYPQQGQQQVPPGYSQPGYPAAPPVAPYGAQPQYPQPYPQPGYAPPQGPQYPPQPQQFAPQPQAPQGPAPSLEGFMDQPSMGGGTSASKFFTQQRPQGAWIQVKVTRDLILSDVQFQKDDSGNVQYFKKGGQPDYERPKYVLVIPTTVIATSDGQGGGTVFADGACALWIKGLTRDALVAAMGTAGVQNPSVVLGKGRIGGAVLIMQSAGHKAAANPLYTATNLFNFTYTLGGTEHLALDAPAEAPVPTAQPSAAPAAATAPAVQYAAPQLPAAQAAPLPAPGPAPVPAAGYSPPPAPQFAPVDQPGQYAYAPPAMVPTPPPGYPNQASAAPQFQQPLPPPPAPGLPPAVPGSPLLPASPVGLPPAPPAGVPQPAVPVPPSYGQPGQPQLSAEEASLLARLNGQG